MSTHPFYDLNWWAYFLTRGFTDQDELLTMAMCKLHMIPYDEYMQLSSLLLDSEDDRTGSGYNGDFDRRYFYPLCISFDISLLQDSTRLEIQVSDRHKLFEDKTVLIANANLSIDWKNEFQIVEEEIYREYPHIPSWHESLKLNQILDEMDEQ